MKLDSHGRVPYMYLSDAEQKALHDWCTLHDVDYKRVPIDPNITLDAVTNEWVIETFAVDDGGHFRLNAQKVVVREYLRRPFKAWLPWRNR